MLRVDYDEKVSVKKNIPNAHAMSKKSGYHFFGEKLKKQEQATI